MQTTKRNPGADLIRILAFLLVVSVHFFLNNGFYGQPVVGTRMYIMTLMRSFFIICVPLFLMLSGYLLRKKQLEKRYYKRIGKIVITYILASLLCVAYSVVCLKQDVTAKSVFFNILNFSAAPYSWYIEMYLGLFLIIPFLNIAYNALPSQKSKIWLIITFVMLTSLPSVVNVYNFDSLKWWAQPSSAPGVTKLIPGWWQTLYPITYYYIGCYLSEYGFKIKKGVNAVLILLWTVLSGSYCYWRSYKGAFAWGIWCDYQSLFNIVLTTLVFTLFININYEKMPKRLEWVIQKISGLSLGGYLVSWIFDSEVYPVLAEKVPEVTHRMEYYFVVVPIIFVASLLASYFISKIQLLLEKCAGVVGKLREKKSAKTAQMP